MIRAFFLTLLFAPSVALAGGALSIPRIGLEEIPVLTCEYPNPLAMDACLREAAIVKYGDFHVYVGHSSANNGREKSPTIFARLPEVALGDMLRIGRISYEVIETRVVGPTALWMLNTKFGQIRLMTCYPIGTSRNRLFVTAKRKITRE